MGKRKNRKQRKQRNRNNALTVANVSTQNTEKKVTETNETKTTETKTTAIVTVPNTNSTTGTTTYISSYSSKKKNYDYQGRKNQTEFPRFVSLCTLGQAGLKFVLEMRLKSAGYTEIISGDGYLYAKGSIPVLLTAHMDTVHKDTVEDYYEYYDEGKKQHIISSPQGIGGDDRCGIYMILEIIKTHKCSVLFCEDEEISGIGSKKFCKTEFINDLSNLKYLIELDRMNGTDAVFYDCENDDFTKFITENTGYEKAYGSFSDISHLSPACGVASVNLSCGYYNAHSTSEYVIMEEMLNTIDVVKKLLDVECEQFEYIEDVYNYGYYGRHSGYLGYDYDYNYYGRSSYRDKYSGIYDDDDYYDYTKRNKKSSTTKPQKTQSLQFADDETEKTLLIYIYDEGIGDLTYYASNGKTEDEAFGRFFKNNPIYCFDDVYDYEQYEERYLEDGWYM